MQAIKKSLFHVSRSFVATSSSRPQYLHKMLMAQYSLQCSSRAFATQAGQPSQSRLQHNNKAVRIRGYSVLRDDVQMNVVPYPAIFKENDASYSVNKVGYLTFEFLPFAVTAESADGKKRPDVTRRKVMIVSMKNVRELINLDTSKVADKEEELRFIQYTSNSNDNYEPNTKVMNFAKKAGAAAYEFSVCDVDANHNVKGEVLKTSVTFSELQNLQSLLEYCVPALMGWHVLYQPSLVI